MSFRGLSSSEGSQHLLFGSCVEHITEQHSVFLGGCQTSEGKKTIENNVIIHAFTSWPLIWTQTLSQGFGVPGLLGYLHCRP